MKFDHIADARAWAFERVAARPTANAGMNMAQYGLAGIAAPPSLNEQITDAEKLAQYVFNGEMPAKKCGACGKAT